MGEYIPPEPKAEEKYRIGQDIKNHAVHHQSFKALWETKWKKPCSMGVYPFMYGCVEDFQPVVDKLVAKDMREPYDWDAYASEFFPNAETLVKAAERAESVGENEKASEFYLRASALYRIARFPMPRSKLQRDAWTLGKQVFLRGQSLLPHPVRQVHIRHTHGLSHEGKYVPALFLLPSTASATKPVPCILIQTGLDGYRTELAVWAESWRRKNIATIVFEIPGTGDSPADPSDPTSPDRQLSSLLDWCDTQPGIDSSRICMWGFSTGGMYAVRAAHTHRERLKGAITLGGGCHHMFEREWLNEVNHLEYPFDLAGSLAHKFGYGEDVELFKAEALKFSLLNDGTLGKPCTRLLLVNGTNDEIFPVDDMLLLLHVGPSPKEARFIPNAKHMGEPQSFGVCIRWVLDLFGIEGEVGEVLQRLPFKPRFQLDIEEQEKREAAEAQQEPTFETIRTSTTADDQKSVIQETLPQDPLPVAEVVITSDAQAPNPDNGVELPLTPPPTDTAIPVSTLPSEEGNHHHHSNPIPAQSQQPQTQPQNAESHCETHQITDSNNTLLSPSEYIEAYA